MKISIAMATYNGARFLKEQLESFSTQTRLPDELIVCDDMSSDETVYVVSKFAKTALFDVVLVVNERNLGYTKNFEKAISLCAGDLIFISDQDDVWFANKLEHIEKIFINDPSVLVVLNDQEITDHSLNPSGLTIFSNTFSLGFGKEWLSAGACTAFRSTLVDIITPFPESNIPYDGWIHKVAQALDFRVVESKVLQYYRLHESNTSKSLASVLRRPNVFTAIRHFGLKSTNHTWLMEINNSEYMMSRFAQKEKVLNALNKSYLVKHVISFEKRRNEAIRKRIKLIDSNFVERLFGVFDFYVKGNYRFFSGWKSALKDVLRST